MDEDRHEEVMDAVRAALCSHGYARLTMQDIADESSLSKASLHYHFDTKQALFLAYLDHLYDRFTARLEAAETAAGDDPVDRIEALFECALRPPDDDLPDFRTAILEIEAQAPFVPAYRERLMAFDAHLEARLSAAVEAAVERGRFRSDVDPRRVASFIVTAVTGAHTRSVAIDRPVAETRVALVDYLAGLAGGSADG